MIINVFGLSIAIGFNGCLDTLVSQAYGKGLYGMCGVYLNRARFLNVCFFVPVCIILFLTEEILLATGQDPTVSANAETFVITLAFGIFCLLQRQATNR